MGAVAEVGRSSGVFADEHDARVASVTTSATTNRPAQKIMGPTLRPNTSTDRPIAEHSLEMAHALARRSGGGGNSG